jgi:hypothetical protein
LPDETEPRTRTKRDLSLALAIQICGTITFVWRELPEVRQVLTNPGEQLAREASSDLMTAGILFMQGPFWVRLLRIPIPVRRSNIFLKHVFLFLGRLSFIFGSALFSCRRFQASSGTGPRYRRPSDGRRGLIFVGCLFALFCTSLEVERLGQAFEGHRKLND